MRSSCGGPSVATAPPNLSGPSRLFSGDPAPPRSQEVQLLTSLGLWRTALRRSRADWPVVLASWLLLACALALIAAGTLYTEAVTLAGLRRELAQAAPADRAVVVRTRIKPADLAAADDVIVPELRGILDATGGEVVRVLSSTTFADATADPQTVTDLELLASYESIERHAVLLDGRWAEPGRTPVEATLSDAAALVLGLETGDRMTLASRLDRTRTIEVVVVGTWHADPADPYWVASPLALTGTETGGRYTSRGPFVVARADLEERVLTATVDADWRAVPDLDGFRPEILPALGAELNGLFGRVNARLPDAYQARVATNLPAILATVDRSVLVTQAGILLLLVQFGVLAGYAVILVAALLVERRRAEHALLRARGAGRLQLVGLAFAESVLVALPAALAAPWLAAGLVAAIRVNPALEGAGLPTPLPGPGTFAVAGAGGVLAVIALTIPTVTSTVSIAGVRAAIGRQVGRTLPQRLGLDLALVALAVIAMLQLRLYGAPLTENARGTLGVDPLLVAAPAIGLLGGAVIAIRVVPRLAELLEGPLARGRGLVASLGGRQLSRRPLRYTRAALLLILAAALGTFASAHAATWTRSQADQAAYEAAADVRVTPGSRSDLPPWALGPALRAIPAVRVATPVVRQTIDVSTNIRGGPLLAVDGSSLAEVVSIRPADGRDSILASLRALGDDRVELATIPVPAGTRRLSVSVAGAIAAIPDFEVPAPGFEGLTASVSLVDGDGRVIRFAGIPGPFDRDARLVVPLGSPGPAGQLRVVGLELAVAGIGDSVLTGSVDLVGLSASADESGDAWTDLPLSFDAPWRWTSQVDGGPLPYRSPQGHPDRVSIDQLFGATRATFRLSPAAPSGFVVPALVGDAFLAATSTRVGERVAASVFGTRLTLEIVERVASFPPLDPAEPFVVVDGLSLDLIRFATHGQTVETDEWWLRTDAGATASVAAAASLPPISAASVVDRETLLAGLGGDPLSLGIIGVLEVGSIAALVFAAIGFLVSATVSTAERLGEFALLKAIGLSPRQLLVWLSMESVSLLVVGLLAGTGLGLLLAWLALPFATLTASGVPPVPSPTVVVPPGAAVPTVVLALVLVLATLLLARRQVPAARTSAVLRASDE